MKAPYLILAMLWYGAFIPWCGFKKILPKDEPDSDQATKEEEAGDECKLIDQQIQMEEGERKQQQQEEEDGLRHEQDKEEVGQVGKNNANCQPTQVHISRKKSVAESSEMDMYPV